MYTENKCSVSLCAHSSFIDYRVDSPDTVSMPTRSLRSGRVVDMVKHSGLIYPHVVPRLRNLEISVALPRNVDDPYYYYSPYASPVEYSVHVQIEKLAKLLLARDGQQGHENELSVHGKKWVIKFHCSSENMGIIALKIMLYPIMNQNIMNLLRDGQVTFHIEGKLPKGWKDVMKMLLDNGATVGKVTEFPSDPLDPITAYKLLSYFHTFKQKKLPRSLIDDEEKGRHCYHCGGFHLRDYDEEDYSDDEYPGYPWNFFVADDEDDWYL